MDSKYISLAYKIAIFCRKYNVKISITLVIVSENNGRNLVNNCGIYEQKVVYPYLVRACCSWFVRIGNLHNDRINMYTPDAWI